MFLKPPFVGSIGLVRASVPLLTVTTVCVCTPSTASAQTIDLSAVIASWQKQYEMARNVALTTTAEWQERDSATKTLQKTTMVTAYSPDGKVYIKEQTGDGFARIVVSDGKTASISANPTTFNRIEGSTAQKVVDYYYETHYGFALSPAAQLVNPAYYTTKAPRDVAAKIRGVKRLSQDGVRLTFATTADDGLTMPSFIDFRKVGDLWVPIRWLYRVAGSEYEVVHDTTVSQSGLVLPTQYRYISRSKTPKTSTVRTIVLRYTPLDKQLFALQPTPQQLVLVENADSKAQEVEPVSASPSPN